MMNDIKQIWSDQESSCGKNVVKKRIDSIPKLNCFIGLIGVTGARMFQLEIDSSDSVHKNFLRKFRGVEIQAIPFNQSKTVYTIILLEKELTEIFTMFIEDIIDNLNNIAEAKQALTIINQRVNYWKKLFSRVSGELLSKEKQRGLFGELYFLKKILQNTSNSKTGINTWKGAEGSNQDFVKDRSAVEIKTSKANNLSVHIANEQQLDYTQWNQLFLGLISVTETTGSQHSLKRIIDEIKDLLNNDAETILEYETKLEIAGISGNMTENYDEISYSVNNLRFFKVREKFPSILKRNLTNEAIYNVKYQINISSCTSFEVQENDVLKAII